MSSTINRLSDWWDRVLATTARLVWVIGCSGSFLVAVAIVALQVFGWAKSGEWTPAPLSAALHLVGADLQWAYRPTDWVGAAEIARWFLELHVGIYVWLTGTLLSLTVAQFIDEDSVFK